jgi:5-methylcytosine-specific restriction protein B
MAYWLEFKNDDEFANRRFGGIGGGQAMKYGLYQRQSDQAWMGGATNAPRVLSLEEAVEKARQQRDELLAGDRVLAGLNGLDTSDDSYARLQVEMSRAAPELSGDGWAHKYWFLLHPDKLDDFHSPRLQRFHLLKLLQMPPDRVGILDATAPRFICAGRFVSAASDLRVPITTFSTVLNQRNGPLHRYWKIGTTSASSGESQWPAMRDGGFVSIGWHDDVPNLSQLITQNRGQAKDQIRDWLLPSRNPGLATRNAGEILNFATVIAENDLVLAVKGQGPLGIGRVTGPYAYDDQLDFPHKRPVEWLSLDKWQMPVAEGPRRTVFELGKSSDNLLSIEEHRFRGESRIGPSVVTPADAISATSPLPPLDPLAVRIEAILRRKEL